MIYKLIQELFKIEPEYDQISQRLDYAKRIKEFER